MSDARHRMAMSPGTRGARGTRGEKDPPRDAVSGPEPEPAVAFDNGVESFGRGPGAMQPLRDVSFYIRDNEFPTLLGPSGCRKTAQLRALTGLEQATSGVIRLFGRDILDVPAYRRPVNTVFRHHLRFPHVTVTNNVACGLRHLRVNGVGGHQLYRHRESVFDQAAALGARVG